jgi:hypothetical protein
MAGGYVGANKNGACLVLTASSETFFKDGEYPWSMRVSRFLLSPTSGKTTDDVFGHPTITPHDHVLESCGPFFASQLLCFLGQN